MAAGFPDGFVPWPKDTADHYRAKGYWQGSTLGSILRDGARERPDHTAVTDGERRLGYRELDREADRLRAGLAARGIRAGERVLVHLPNIIEFVPLCFALFRLGAVPVLALPAHRETEIVSLARLSGAVAYVIPDEHAGFDHRPLARCLRERVPSVREVIVVGDADGFTSYGDVVAAAPSRPKDGTTPEPDPSEVAVLLLSGGTTGLPKLIPRTHDDYHYNVRASARVCGFDEDTRYLTALPMAHNFPLACPGMLGTLWAGGTVVLSTGANPHDAFRLIESEGVTATALVPPLALAWLDAAEQGAGRPGTLKLLQVGGSRLKEETARRVGPLLGCSLQQVYGMAEGLLNFTRSDDPPELVLTTQGRPLSEGDEVRIVAPDGSEVPDGEVGELQVRGPYTIRGYHRAEEHNATAFTPDGHYRTGDLVRRLPSGHLVVEGRTKDVINRGGDKIPVEEVENHLLAHPAIHDVALVGLPDDTLGERTWACVIPGGTPPTRRELLAHLTARGVAAYKHPDRVRIMDDFPRTGLGKVNRRELARRLREA
ncbi:AMP-binding protein [Streptomyces alkaliphilus]|uniref:AMP-binding protein n=1 Tax=Streptomyces alkaliphilus TaxID=1472722 RepID=A0A7W3T9N6_9ACTN|nr:AMP-binding protein [Streptomyces alkaliphilus]MBB0242580.1 AMP-binding protein [Streptomyces alkaliphilus]